MKKLIYLLILVLLMKIPIFAQTVYWEEEFNSATNWTMEGNWAISSGFLQFYWSPDVSNFDMSAISPVITLHENIDEIIVNQYLDVFSGTPNEVAEIIIIHGSEETVLWEYVLQGGNWGSPEGTEIMFSLSDYAGMDVQFKFRTYGATTYNWNWWNIYNIKLTAYFNNDLCLHSIIGPNNLDMNQSGTWNVEIKNLGLEPQSNFSVDLFSYKTSELIDNVTITNELLSGESEIIDFTWTPVEFQNTALYAIVTANEDDFTENDISESCFLRVNPDAEFSILVWDNDNDIETIIDPEKGDYIQGEVGITRALDAAGINYDLVSSLPAGLNDYDIVFATMGCYCLS